VKLQALLKRGLNDTAELWPEVDVAFGWVHQAAHLLANEAGLTGTQVRRRLSGLLGAMARWQTHAGSLATAVEHCATVTRSYWPGLFHCYDVPDLPRTNNELEQFFGAFRYHERRATGRKVAAPSLVVRGSARLLAAAITRQRPFSAADLAACDRQAWRALRATLDDRQQARVQQRRFRQDPQAYLADLENHLFKLTLPP
jgi:hypothetical protein